MILYINKINQWLLLDLQVLTGLHNSCEATEIRIK